MRSVDSALEFGLGLLSAGLQPLEPEEERLPMDAEDDPKGEEGVFEGKPQKSAVSEGNAFSGQGAEEFALLAAVIVDENTQGFLRKVEPEIEFEIEIGKGGDVIVLHDTTMEGAIPSERHKVGLPFPEGIPHLRDRGEGRPCFVEAVIDGDRIEDVTEHSWESQQENPADLGSQALIPEVSCDILPGGRGSMTDMIALPKAVEAGPVDSQQAKRSSQQREFLQIDQNVEEAITELMSLRCKAAVKDRALVEAGVHLGRHRKLLIWKTGSQEFWIYSQRISGVMIRALFRVVVFSKTEDFLSSSFLEFLSSKLFF